MSELESRIQRVAIYLRKSRADEGEKDLINHENRLVGIAEDKGWSFDLYKEIGSGSSLDSRQKMLELLSDMREDMFDAILVMDIDRLSRSAADQERIFRELQLSNTLIVTGASYAVLDPFNDADTDMIHFKSFFSSHEHKMIKRRFKEAKTQHSSRGHWTSGRAPFCYQFDKKTRSLVIKQDEADIVRRVVKEFILGKSSGDIAWELNSDGLLSQTGALWSNRMINRLLQNDIYLGNTTYNKSQGTRKSNKHYTINSVPYKQLPKSEWRTVYNTHEALVSKEEREQIDKHYADWSKRRAKVNADGTVFDLSGLCESSNGMRYTRRFDARSKKETLIIGHDTRIAKEEYPEHRRVDVELVRKTIAHSVKQMEQELSDRLKQNDNQAERDSLEKQIKKLEDKHKVILDSFDRLVEGYSEGLYDIDTMKRMKQKKEEEQLELEEMLRKTRQKLDTISNSKNIDKLERVRKFQEDISNATSNQEINILYKSIIKKIICDRLTPEKTRVKVSFI